MIGLYYLKTTNMYLIALDEEFTHLSIYIYKDRCWYSPKAYYEYLDLFDKKVLQ